MFIPRVEITFNEAASKDVDLCRLVSTDLKEGTIIVPSSGSDPRLILSDHIDLNLRTGFLGKFDYAPVWGTCEETKFYRLVAIALQEVPATAALSTEAYVGHTSQQPNGK